MSFRFSRRHPVHDVQVCRATDLLRKIMRASVNKVDALCERYYEFRGKTKQAWLVFKNQRSIEEITQLTEKLSTGQGMMEMNRIHVQYNPVPLSSPLTNSAQVSEFLRVIWDNEKINLVENLYVLFLNNQNQVMGWDRMHVGTSREIQVDTGLLVSLIGSFVAKRVILAHNHPSGRVRPSLADVKITKNIEKVCELINARLEDHVILTEGAYYSFRDNGLLMGQAC
jgi:DNA repair protein RadC